jgi:hypothetical protein
MSDTHEYGVNTLGRTAMVAGEVLLPGASELIAGKITSGVAHFLLAGLAGALLGPTMPVLAVAAAIGIRADSYTRATTGTSVVDAVTNSISAASSSKAADSSHASSSKAADKRSV